MGTLGAPPPFPPSSSEPAGDATSTALWTASSALEDTFNWLIANGETVAKWLHDTLGLSKLGEETLALFVKILAFIPLELLKAEESTYTAWLTVLVSVLEKILPAAETAQEAIGELLFPILTDLLQASAGDTLEYGAGPLANFTSSLMSQVVTRFTLVNTGVDPNQPGSGLQNQQYLLRQALGIAVAQWFIDSMQGHLGMGVLRVFQPVLNLLESAVNPMNAVREAMDASIGAFVRTPLVRDINNAHPIKNLGLSSLAKLFIRGAIDETTYLQRCKDSGLPAEQAEELLIEAATLPSVSEISTMLQDGQITEDDALTLMKQRGYPDPWGNRVLYVETHERFRSLQQTVANDAIAAWKKGYIDQPTMEQVLQQMGYQEQEILLVEIEGEFTSEVVKLKQTKPAGSKTLTYDQVKQAFEHDLLSIDDVITFLTNEGYNADDLKTLVLLDFTVAAERQARQATLDARLRVQEETALEQAQKDLAKNETALAKAKQQLAGALDQEQKLFGELTTASGVLTLLGIFP